MNTKSIQTVGSFGPLSPYIKAYLVQVKEQGYASRSICGQVLDENLQLKEAILAKMSPLRSKPRQYRPNDQLLSYLKAL